MPLQDDGFRINKFFSGYATGERVEFVRPDKDCNLNPILENPKK